MEKEKALKSNLSAFVHQRVKFMEIAGFAITHKKATLKEIETAWHGDLKVLINKILSNPDIYECAILMTCNRVEVYVVGKNTEEILRKIASRMHVSDRVVDYYKNSKCVEHLFRVASGLESMIVGEDQILGQVKEFYRLCKEYGGIGKVLDLVFSKAIHVGTKIRKLTNINKGSVSIGSAAVELAEKKLGSLEGKRVVLVGAGEMAKIVAKNLAYKNCKISIANRTLKNAEKLIKEVGGKAYPLSELENLIAENDIIISATSASGYIITADTVKKACEKSNKKLFIDIAMPRDIDPEVGKLGFEVYTIDDLREISEENLKKRIKEAKKAEKIINKELMHFNLMLKDLKANSAISAMYTRAEDVKKDEVLELYNKLSAKYGVDESVLPILEEFASSFIKKFLRLPTVRLRKAAREGKNHILDAVEYVFGGDDIVPCIKNEEAEEGSPETSCARNRTQSERSDSTRIC